MSTVPIPHTLPAHRYLLRMPIQVLFRFVARQCTYRRPQFIPLPTQRVLPGFAQESRVTPHVPDLGGVMRGKSGLVAVGCAALMALTATSAVADPSSSDRHGRNGPLVVGRFSH